MTLAKPIRFDRKIKKYRKSLSQRVKTRLSPYKISLKNMKNAKKFFSDKTPTCPS
jgi:hypothetical protein